MLTIVIAVPDEPAAQEVIRAYTTEVASRWYGRSATDDEVDRARTDEPSDDLRGTTGAFFVAMEDGHAVDPFNDEPYSDRWYEKRLVDCAR